MRKINMNLKEIKNNGYTFCFWGFVNDKPYSFSIVNNAKLRQAIKHLFGKVIVGGQGADVPSKVVDMDMILEFDTYGTGKYKAEMLTTISFQHLLGDFHSFFIEIDGLVPVDYWEENE